MILELEEIAMNAWPALRTLVYDGWVLRFSNGYTRRANAIHPLYTPTLPLDEKIETCERLYAAHDLPALYKMTDAAQPTGLDAALEARGYERDGSNRIMTLALERTRAVSPLAQIEPAVTEAWIADYVRLHADRARHSGMLKQLFSAIALPAAYIRLKRDETVVGVAVAERGSVGLFGLAVDPGARRQGLGMQLTETCIAWGMAQGATRAYLQVAAGNAPANGLYERAGFREVYRYWYRQQPV
jgi:GNAT superfamily N-acetyltransferase